MTEERIKDAKIKLIFRYEQEVIKLTKYICLYNTNILIMVEYIV